MLKKLTFRNAIKSLKLCKKRLLAVVMVTAIACSTAVTASAAVQEGASSRIDKTWLAEFGDYRVDVPGNWKEGQMEMLTLKADGTPVYCLEFFKSINSNSALGKPLDQSALWNGLSDSAQAGITRASLYGYPNNTFESNAREAYAATQVVAWQYILGMRTDASLVGTQFDAYLNRNSGVKRAYQGLLEKIGNHSSTPSFYLSTAQLQGIGQGYAQTFSDTNGVLSQFSVSSSTSDVGVSQNGNSLTIWANNAFTGDVALSATKAGTNGFNNALCFEGAGQAVLYGTLDDPVFFRMSVRVVAGKIQINKTSEDGMTGIFSFNVHNGTGFNQNFAVDGNNSILIENVLQGTYTITEINTPGNYIQPTSQTVTVHPGTTTTANFNNALKNGSAQFKKTDLDTNKEIETKDGIFGVYEWNSDAKTYSKHSTMSYDEGKSAYSTGDLKATYFNKGYYKIIEEKAPTGYVRPTSVNYEFQITQNGQLHNINNGTVTNAPQKAKIQVTKQGEKLIGFDFIGTEHGVKHTPIYDVANLEGATYEISALEDIIVNGEIKHIKGTVVDTITTGADGNAISKEIYLGKYLVRETIAPEGYFIGANEYEIELAYKGDMVNVFTESITSFNDRQKMKLSLQKDFEYNHYYPNSDAWQDVMFGVYSSEGILNEVGEVLLEKDSLVDVFAINEGGQGLGKTDLSFGKYYIKELVTDEQYVLDTKTYEFEFTPQSQDINLYWLDINEAHGELVNKTRKAYVEIIKLSSFEETRLAGAVYGIYSAKDDTLIQELTTDKDGYAKSSLIPYGAYYLQEISPPFHYHNDETRYNFTVGDSEEEVTVNIDVANQPIIGVLNFTYEEKNTQTESVEGEVKNNETQIPNTSDDCFGIGITTMILVISAMATLLLIRKKQTS